MSDLSQISDISEEQYLSDENFELNEEIQMLKQNLTETYITKFFKKKYKLKMHESNSKKSTNISNEEYFKKHEQINEVKYNLFMIMYNRCKINEEYSTIINLQNEFKLRRLTIQECTINNNTIIPGEKRYSFIPKTSNKGKGAISNYEFSCDKDIISIEIKDNVIDNMKINNVSQTIFDEETLISEYKISLPKIENELKERSTQPKSDKGNRKKKPEKLNDIKFAYSSPKKNNEASSYKSNDSLKEFIGKTVYVKKENHLMRYIYLDLYEKEIDGIYTKHNGINLNKDNIISINDLLNSPITYNDNNDLKAHIIFKNFKENKIEANTPFILEIKKNFKLYELMQQIKQDCKILGNIMLNRNNIAIPKYIIGVLCRYSDIRITKEIEALNKMHINSNIKEIDYIEKIIQNNNMNVIICMLKEEKIGNYQLGIEDYKIENEEIKYRVDIGFMHNKIFNKEIDKELLTQIIEENKEKYRSLTAEKTYTYDEYKKIKDDLNDKNEEIAKLRDEKNEEIEKIQNKIAKIQNDKNEEIAKLQEEKNEMMLFLRKLGLMDKFEKIQKDKKG